MSELEKLKKYLDDNGYDCEMNCIDFGSLTNNKPNQIIVYGPDHITSWDVVCHDYSYGGPDGLLELYGELCTDVIGWLTADDMIRILEYFKAKGPNWKPINVLSDIEVWNDGDDKSKIL